jgi:hypothetical protein
MRLFGWRDVDADELDRTSAPHWIELPPLTGSNFRPSLDRTSARHWIELPPVTGSNFRPSLDRTSARHSRSALGNGLTALNRQDQNLSAVKSHRFPLEVLFPQVRGKVFELLFGANPREHYVRELALRTHLTLHTIQDELRKLSALGLVTARPSGLHRYYQANRSHALYAAIHQIVVLSSKSPRARVTDLQRRPGKRSSKRNRKVRRAHLKLPYGPINWGTLRKES